MNLVGEGMMKIVVKAAQYGVRMKEIVLPLGQYLAFAHACKVREVDAKPRAFFDGSMSNEVLAHDSFRFASPSGYITIRCDQRAPSEAMVGVAAEIVEERQRQVKKFGEQHHPDGIGHAPISAAHFLAEARARCDKATGRGPSDTYGTLTWEEILTEEYAEALCETDPDKLRVELLQVAAVCAAWIEDIDARKK